MTVMLAMLRRHGAAVVERDGRLVAAHFGSPTTEAAICRTQVGLAERSDRATLELRGAAADVDGALSALGALGERAWSVRPSPERAIVRCDARDQEACTAALARTESAAVRDRSAELAALALIGPRAAEVLRATALREDEDPVDVLVASEQYVELLVPRSHGPALWNRLLEAGEPFGIACVGIDALEHLAVSEQLTRMRGPAAPRA